MKARTTLSLCSLRSLIPLILVFATAKMSWGNPVPTSEEIERLYHKGAYGQTVQKIETYTQSNAGKSSEEVLQKQKIGFYYGGLSSNKLQEYDKAVVYFEKAIRAGSQEKDLYFELGQAYFATQEMTKSRESFAHSVKNQYLVPASLYYMANISQTLEEYRDAMKIYRTLEKNPSDVTQAASFQIAEILVAQLEKKKDQKENVKKFIIPQLDKAYLASSDSSLAKEILARKQEILDKYDLDENRLRNGRKIDAKRYEVKFMQNNDYDTNVINQADLSTARSVHTDSLVLKQTLYAKYNFVVDRRFIFTPQIKGSLTHMATHRQQPSITNLDAFFVDGYFKNSYEHTALSAPAELFYELQHIYTERHQVYGVPYSFFSRFYSAALGEKLRLLPFGDTTFKIKQKRYFGISPDNFSNTTSFTLSQLVGLNGGNLLLFYSNVDLLLNPYNPLYSQNIYTFRVDLIHPQLFGKYFLDVAMNTIITNTMRQKSTRGIEKMLDPSISLSRKFFNYFEIIAKYEFIKNISKSKTGFAYSKNQVGLELNAKF
jgi:hypothetical protein